jgi:diaminopimelate decarboxylase
LEPLLKSTVAGNINEALDLLAEEIYLPPIEEGEYLAFLNMGAYGSSTISNHCMRGKHTEYLLL